MASKLNVAGLDFVQIKENLKNYLRDQQEFSDFDFEGSGMNILLDILAYNTHYNSYYLNMIANEMFLDSAVLRPSVVSHAKLLGYTPRSTVSSVARVNVAITKAQSDDTTTLTLPRFTNFVSQSVDGVSYAFVTVDSQTTENVGRVFTFTDVELKQGIPVSYVYTVDNSSNPKQRFELPDDMIDTSTLQVRVQKSSTEVETSTYVLATDATQVTTTSKVYYLEEGESGKYVIYFGDNIFGAKLEDGNLIAVSYLVSDGVGADKISKFKMSDLILAGSTSSIITAINSAGGSARETVDDIKFAAPKSFISNGRAVTKNDYITLINQKYPYFDAVNVWGGEEEEPPIYGKVFIAVKPKAGYEVTNTQKEYVINQVLKPISVMTVTPQFVDVNYNYLKLVVDVEYDMSLTSFTSGQIRDIVRAAIINYSDQNLNTFTSAFRISKLMQYISDADPSIQSSSIDVFIQKKLKPVLNSSETYVLNFETELRRTSYTKEKIFSTPAYVQEDVNGVLRNIFLEETPESFSGIESVEVENSGQNYTKTPIVAIDGDGSGAELQAVIVNGKLKGVNVITPGTGYTTAVLTIRNAEGDTTGRFAQAKAIVHGRTGNLRSYYFDDLGVKKIQSANAGSIDYVDGIISLNNFAPLDIVSDTKILNIYAKPNSFNIQSSRQTIVSLDDTDATSITVNVRAIS